MRPKILIISLVLFSSIFGQIGGISGSKLLVPDAGSLPIGIVEFEPSLSSFSSNKVFCEDGNIERLGIKTITSDLALRVTAGLFENFEIGSTFSTSIEEIGIGSKYIFLNSEKFSTGMIAGFTLPAGNKSFADSENVTSDSRFTFGMLNSYRFTDRITVDGIFSLTNKFQTEKFSPLINYGIGIGDWVTDKFQLVTEINGLYCSNGAFSSSKVSFNAGFTYKVSKILLFVLGSQIDLFGKSTDKSWGYFSAFTFAFE